MSLRQDKTAAGWLASIGLSRCAAAFAENGIGDDVLTDLTDVDLTGIGIVLGDRKRLLRAIAALRHASPAAPAVAPSGTPSGHPASWRRHLTVLFCDLVGSTKLSHRLDPEDFSQVIHDFQDACSGAITRGDGYIARFMGDGVLAYFGYPQAQEDDAQSAAHVGLEIVARVAQLRTPDGEGLHVRVGIATGPVVVLGEAIGSGIAQEQSVVGETPNLAARLQDLAEPDTVLVTDSTHQLLGTMFADEDRGLHPVKGLDAPVQIWRVLGERRNKSRFDATRSRNLTQLIGRMPEYARLAGLWTLACSGSGRVAMLSGEAGIGKSHLCRTLLDAARQEPHYTLRYQCSAHHAQSPLYPIIGQLEHVASFEREDSPDTKLDKLQLVLRNSFMDQPGDLALLAALLSIPSGSRCSLPEMSPSQLRERTIEALIRQLFNLSARKPVLLVMEDLQWSDPTTLEVLNRCLEGMRTAPVLALLTFRPDFRPPWADQPHIETLRLTGLGHDEVIAMIERLTSGRSLPPDVHQQIVSRTDGVPLFVEELTRTVLESGILRESGGSYELARPLPALAIPATLQETLMARLDRLASIREVAQAAAAIGRRFSFRLLSSVIRMPRAELAAALAQLAGADMIHGQGDPPESDYIFKHSLVQGVAYETMLRSQRRQLHARIAEVLVEEFAVTAETQPELIAHHLAQGGLTEKAIQYLRQAAERAIQRSANTEAISQLDQARQLLHTLPDTTGLRRSMLDVDAALGQARIAGLGYAAPQTREALIRARANITDTTEPEKQLGILYGLWAGYLVGCDLPRQQEISNEFLAQANRLADPAAQCIANRMLGTTLITLGEFDAARICLERACALYDPVQHPRYRFQYGQDIGAIAFSYLSWTLWHLGQYDRALRMARQVVRRAQVLAHPHTIAYTTHHTMGMLDVIRGRPKAARLYIGGLLRLSDEHDFPYWGAGARLIAGWSDMHLGETERGNQLFQAGLAGLQHGGARISVPYYLALQAEAQARLGDADAALGTITSGFEMAALSGERWSTAELLRIRAGILLRCDRPDTTRAEAMLGEGLELAQQQGARFWQARIAADLAQLWQDSGRGHAVPGLLAQHGTVPAEFLRDAEPPGSAAGEEGSDGGIGR